MLRLETLLNKLRQQRLPQTADELRSSIYPLIHDLKRNKKVTRTQCTVNYTFKWLNGSEL